MTGIAIAAALIVAAVVVVFLVGLSRPDPQTTADSYATELSRMPAEIANGRLVLSERRLSTNRPIPLIARVDQVFLVEGRLVPVETKTRFLREVFDYDRIELGVQAVVLAHAKVPELRGYPVADYAFVRLVRPDGAVVYRRTSFPTEQQVVAMAERRLALEQGREDPRAAVSPRLCRSCGQRDRCPKVA